MSLARPTVALALVAATIAVAVLAAFLTHGRSESPSPSVVTAGDVVPALIGFNMATAEARLREHGLSLELVPGEVVVANASILKQWPPAGWTVTSSRRIVRVRLASDDVVNSEATMTAEAARAAISQAQLRLAMETGGPWQVAELAPFLTDDKGEPCRPDACAYVRFNATTGGATVTVDLTRDNPIIDVGRQTSRFPPGSGFTEDELVAAALGDPAVMSSLEGHAFDAYFLSYGAPGGGPCPSFDSTPLCATVVIQVEGGSPALVSVNYMTLDVVLVQPPG